MHLSVAKAPSRSNAKPPVIALRDVRLADGPVQLFDGVDLALEPRVRAALVGKNGAGKSTLMRILSGKLDPDDGDRFIQPGLRSVYVPQEPEIVGETLLDHATAGGAMIWDAEAALQEFGLDPSKSTQGLSGGEIRRTALARAFAEQPDLLLLDEPTNHLDVFAIETLERQITASRAALLVVSHDRAFLNRVTERCFWLAHRKVRTYDQGFSGFEDWATKIEAEEEEALRRLSKAIERETETFYSSITARRTRNEGRARRLDEMRAQKSVLMRDQTRSLELVLDAGGVSGKRVLEVKDLSKSFGERVIVKDFTTRIVRGDRLAIVGPNGAGKTTLVKLMLGEIEADAGTVILGTGLEAAYLDQARAELKADQTLWEALTPLGGDSVLVRGYPKHVAAFAKEFLFRENQLRQPVASLSGGERNRLLLARALTKAANLLVLDEPTNDLDMDTLDLLEEMLADYEGTLILVSHDRDFIDRLATSTLGLDGRGNVAESPGGWTEFNRQHPRYFTAPEARPAARLAQSQPVIPKKASAKLSYKDQRRLEECEKEMGDLPVEIEALEARLADPGLYARDPRAFDAAMQAAGALRVRLAKAEEDWLALEEKRETLG
jgi:ATP-binding cassette subfamily F protein uup